MRDTTLAPARRTLASSKPVQAPRPGFQWTLVDGTWQQRPDPSATAPVASQPKLAPPGNQNPAQLPLAGQPATSNVGAVRAAAFSGPAIQGLPPALPFGVAPVASGVPAGFQTPAVGVNPVGIPQGQQRLAVAMPGASERMRVRLPDPQAFLTRRTADFEALEGQRLQRERDLMNAGLSARGLYSAGGSAEMDRRLLEESGRRGTAFLTDLMVEAERQRQANARDEFGLNLGAAEQERRFDLSRFGAGQQAGEQEFSQGLRSFGAGEEQAGRLGQEALQRFQAGRQAGREDREYGLQLQEAERLGQGQAFAQSVQAAEAQQRLGLNTFRAQQEADQQEFSQILEAHREGRATEAQLTDTAVKVFETQRQAEQQDFQNLLNALIAEGNLTRQDAESALDAANVALAFRRQEQQVLLELAQIADLSEDKKTSALLGLFGEGANTVDAALDRFLQAANLDLQRQTTNQEIAAANARARNQRRTDIAGALSGAFT